MDFDLIVAGGGVVGATFTLAMAAAGRRILLIETAAAPAASTSNDDYDLRVFAINRASQRIFENLGVWAELPPERLGRFDCMQIWDTQSIGNIRFEAAALAEPHLGHIIENRLLLRALYRCLAAYPRVSIAYQQEIQAVSPQARAVEVCISDGRRLITPLLVGADGANSSVRRLAGIGVSRHDYGQQAIVCHLRTELPHQQTAWQAFLPGGPLAFLPLANGACSIVWSLPSAQAKDLMALSEADFTEQVQTAFGTRLGTVDLLSPRIAFDLQRQHALRYVAPGMALIGDAAHVVHPLAGQGVNLGLLDAAALAEILTTTRRGAGDLSGLRRYERWRRGDNQLMLKTMDGFHYLFGARALPLVWLRSLGLNLTDAASLIKHRLMAYAAGLDGDLPDLARLG